MASKQSEHTNNTIQSLHASMELLSNLIYLARHAETDCEERHRYLNHAGKIIEELAHHPMLRD